MSNFSHLLLKYTFNGHLKLFVFNIKILFFYPGITRHKWTLIIFSIFNQNHKSQNLEILIICLANLPLRYAGERQCKTINFLPNLMIYQILLLFMFDFFEWEGVEKLSFIFISLKTWSLLIIPTYGVILCFLLLIF